MIVKASEALDSKGKLKKNYREFYVRGQKRYMTSSETKMKKPSIIKIVQLMEKEAAMKLEMEKEAAMKLEKCAPGKKRVGPKTPVSKVKKCVAPKTAKPKPVRKPAERPGTKKPVRKKAPPKPSAPKTAKPKPSGRERLPKISKVTGRPILPERIPGMIGFEKDPVKRAKLNKAKREMEKEIALSRAAFAEGGL